jgi:peptide/nickel transport system substrate-binding protein
MPWHLSMPELAAGGLPTGHRHFSSPVRADPSLQMLGPTMGPDPGLFMKAFLSSEVASKQNKWQGRNTTRWQNPEYDRLYAQSEVEIDPVKRATMLIALNDMVIKNVELIPVVTRPDVTAVANNLHAPLGGWDRNLFAIEDWYRDT